MELFLTLILAATAAPAPAPVVVTSSGVELEILADETMIPGAVGQFFIETTLPEACGERVLFLGFDDRVRLGLYSATSSGVEIIADTTIPVPGSVGTFQEAREERCLGERAFFLGSATARPNLRRSVFEWRDGELSVVLETGTAIGGELIRSVNDLDVNELGIVGVADFLFPSPLDRGVIVQRFGAEPILIADDSTVLPGQTQPLGALAKPTAIGHNVFFQASTGLETGIYRWNESEGLSLVVDDANPVPELGGARFTIFDQVTKLDDGLVFGAGYTGGFGIFLWRNGQVEHLVAPGDVTEEGETLLGASFPRGEGTLLAFVGGTTESGGGAFVRKHDGSLKRIVAVGEEIAGASVRRLLVDADRESVALRLDHPDANEVTVFRAHFPEPLPATTEIPTLSEIGISLLTLTLALAGLKLLRRSA